MICNKYRFPAILLMNLFIIALFSSACSYNRSIITEQFDSLSVVNPGEPVTIKWKFKNADAVVISGFKDTLKPEGDLYVKLDEPKLYKFKVFRDNSKDTLFKTAEVRFKEKVTTGNENQVSQNIGLPKSFEPNEYLSGYRSEPNQTDINRIRIIRTIYPSNENAKEYSVRFLALDEYGNYLRSLKLASIFKTQLLSISDSLNPQINLNMIREVSNDPIKTRINISIFVDNSAAAMNNTLLNKEFNNLFDNYKLNDNINIKYFNHNNGNSALLSSFGKLIPEALNHTEANGFNAFYRNLFQTISEMDSKNEKMPDVFLIVLFSSDNASVVVDANDIAKILRKIKVPAYIVTIGTDYNSYSLKYLTDYSGGKLYNIDEDNISEIKNIIYEVIQAQKNYYEVRFKLEDMDEVSGEKQYELSISNDKAALKDYNRIIYKPFPQFSDYQALAGFDIKDTVLKDTYKENLQTLAEVIMDNPNVTAEITGHAGIEGNNDQTLSIGLSRAQSVRKQLIAYGVAPHQIRIFTEGCNRPIYFIEQYPWQSYYNRRVDMRWIVPEQMPYEIIAEIAVSEEEALTFVEKWENLGYKSYYERYLQNNNPIYRVKIWGYKTIEEADTIANKLRKQFKKITFVVR